MSQDTETRVDWNAVVENASRATLTSVDRAYELFAFARIVADVVDMEQPTTVDDIDVILAALYGIAADEEQNGEPGIIAYRSLYNVALVLCANPQHSWVNLPSTSPFVLR